MANHLCESRRAHGRGGLNHAARLPHHRRSRGRSARRRLGDERGRAVRVAFRAHDQNRSGQATSCPAPTVAAVDQPRAVEPPAVTVVPAVNREFVDRLFVSGTLVAREEAQVAARVDGLTIVELDAEDGDRVKEGQVLARLDRTQLDALIAQNDAATKRADAAIDQAQSMIAQSEAQVHFADDDFDRARKLGGGVMSVSTIEQRETAMKTAAGPTRGRQERAQARRGRSQEPRRGAAGALGAHRPDGGEGARFGRRQPALGQARRRRDERRRAALPHHRGRSDRSRGRRARAVAGQARRRHACGIEAARRRGRGRRPGPPRQPGGRQGEPHRQGQDRARGRVARPYRRLRLGRGRAHASRRRRRPLGGAEAGGRFGAPLCRARREGRRAAGEARHPRRRGGRDRERRRSGRERR